MSNDVLNFLKYLEYQEDEANIKNLIINKVVIIKDQKRIEVYFENNEVLPYKTVFELTKLAKKKNDNIKTFQLYFHYTTITLPDILAYIHEWLELVIQKKPSLMGLKDTSISIDDDIITIEVGSSFFKLMAIHPLPVPISKIVGEVRFNFSISL